MVTEYEIRALSLPLIGSLDPNFCPIDHNRFKAKFGVMTELCAKTWNLMVENLTENDVDLTGYCLNPVHILYALFFLRCYPTAHQTVGTLGHSLSMVTFWRFVYLVIRQIAVLSDKVVSWYTLNADHFISFITYHLLSLSHIDSMVKLSQTQCRLPPKSHCWWYWLFMSAAKWWRLTQ